MKKTSKIFYSFIVVTLMVFNFQFVFQNQGSVNLDFFSITNALAAESGTPSGSICKEGDCSVTIGEAPYAVTYTGKYRNCINADSGTCIPADCNRVCDPGPH